MKNKTNLILLVVIGIMANSCINDFELDVGDSLLLVVIEGKIDNDGNNYVRLTYSNPLITNPDSYPLVDAVPIKNATIEITDNTGYSETMKPIDESGGVFRGYYEAINLVGKAENTYYLTVIVEGKTYTSEAYMPSVPKIDSVGTLFVQGDPGKFNSSKPLIYFNEPQEEKNYYLTKICHVSIYNTGIDCRYINRVWNFSILDDIFLDSYVNGLNLDDGASPDGRDFNIIFSEFDEVELQLYSLTKEAFEYYDALIKQFNNDGGVYQPSPASAPSNINGGALGFFNASAVSKKLIEFDPG